ncbi:MAG: hypothetical protein JWN02_2217 [Acidobacteria bacterium]|nr:hypothetical protein [Acidobacteriota bacterium]
MKRLAALLAIGLLALATGCATADGDDDRDGRYGRPDRGQYGRPGNSSGEPAEGSELALPSQWWRDPQIAPALALSNDQFAALDRIDREQAPEIERLHGETMAAARDYRLILDLETPAAADIASAAQRLRTVRDRQLEAQLRLLSDERLVLTKQQWSELQSQTRKSRQSPREGNGPGGGRGRGRRGGGGFGGGYGGGGIRP